MRRVCMAALALGSALSSGGCSIGVASIGPIASAPPPGPAPVVYGAFLDGPVGQKLGQADKDKALAAEQEALASGQRRTWKGDRGTFGYVEPAVAEASSDANAPACRPFTSTIYLGGRPQVGHGKGCQTPDGAWTIS